MLEELNFDNYSFKSINIINSINSKIKDLDYKSQRFIDDYDGMKTVMKKSFIHKSFIQKQYFLNNISQMYNTMTKKPIVDFYDNENAVIDYQRDLTYSLDKNNEISYRMSNELISGQFIKNQNRTKNYKRFSKVRYLEHHNQDKKKFFLTWTLTSNFHKFKQKEHLNKSFRKYESEQLVLNPNYEFDNFEEGIIKGLETLNEIHRYFYKNFKRKIEYKIKKSKKHLSLRITKLSKLKEELIELKKDRKANKNLIIKNQKKRRKLIYSINYSRDIIKNKKEYYNFDFIKMIEPHKSLTPHQHSLLWITPKFEQELKRARKATVKEFGLNQKYQDLEIVTSAKASTYIIKYLMKEIDLERDEDGVVDIEASKDEENTFEIYKQYFGKHTKFFTTSNFKTKGLNQKKIDIMYSYLRDNRPNILSAMKRNEKDIPMYVFFELLYKKGIFKFEERENESEEYTKYHILRLSELKDTQFKKDLKIFFKDKKNHTYTYERENKFGDKNIIEVKQVCDINTKKLNYAIKDITIKPYFKVNNTYIEEQFKEFQEEAINKANSKLLEIYSNKYDAKKIVNGEYVSYDLNDYKKMLKHQYKDDLNSLIESKAKELLIEDINNKMNFCTYEENPYLDYSKGKIITKVYYKDSYNPQNKDYKLIYQEGQYEKEQIDLDVFVDKYVNYHGFTINHDYYKRNHIHHRDNYKDLFNKKPSEKEIQKLQDMEDEISNIFDREFIRNKKRVKFRRYLKLSPETIERLTSKK
ncbi:MAG: hypothetical protein CL623_12265 [Arcobacter sp.]|nr:hypothetical protein [Arcobacter sp.]